MLSASRFRLAMYATLSLSGASCVLGRPASAQTVSAVPVLADKPPTGLAPLSPAAIDNSLAIGGADISARKIETRMTIAVGVEKHGPFRFVVDSGADTSALSSSVARALGLPPAPSVMLHGMTASGVVDRVVVGTLNIGQSTFNDMKLPVLKEENLGAQGLLGIDALVEQRLMLDFDKRIITVEDGRRPPPRSENGDIVVVARRRHGQLILTQASAEGHAVDAVIDTGSEITIGNTALRDRIFGKRHRKLETAEAIGVTGVVLPLELAHLSELRVGPILMQDVTIAFADVPPFAAFGLLDRPAMFLGTDLLGSFRRVSLDFHARKVRFQLKKCRQTGLVVATTGMLSRLSSVDPAANAC